MYIYHQYSRLLTLPAVTMSIPTIPRSTRQEVPSAKVCSPGQCHKHFNTVPQSLMSDMKKHLQNHNHIRTAWAKADEQILQKPWEASKILEKFENEQGGFQDLLKNDPDFGKIFHDLKAHFNQPLKCWLDA